MTRQLPLPAFYDPRHAGDWSYRADHAALFDAALRYRKAHGIVPAARDSAGLHLLLIDVQKDFCMPDGTLFVGGRSGHDAVDDSRRIAELIYRNLGRISQITTTLDTHFAFQIFFAPFWQDQDGGAVEAHRTITSEQIQRGEVRPRPELASWLCGGNYSWLLKQVQFYCSQLEKAGKYELYLWPPHAILGSAGHALVGIIEEARFFHSLVRGSQSWCEVKGGHPLTENYSVLRPEVLERHDGLPLSQRNTGFLDTLLGSDAVVIGGQAASHCVKSTIDDLLEEILGADPALARKVYVLTDCMSSVAIPDGQGGFVADFTQQSLDAQQRFADAGMNLVKSTDPLESWPGLGQLLAA